MDNYSFFSYESKDEPNNFLFFCQQESQQKKSIAQKVTNQCAQGVVDFLENEKFLKTISLNLPKNQKEGLFYQADPRPRLFIETSIKPRKEYLDCKKGMNEQTNQLTINFHTFIKSHIDQFMVFTELEDEELKLLKQFKVSKPNLASIRKILGCQIASGQKGGQKNIQLMVAAKADKFRGFLLDKMHSANFLGNLWKSKKMSMKSKLVFVKYLKPMLRALSNPESFTGWKQLNY